MNIRITCDQWWKPAATVDEVRQADSARRVDGRTYVAVDISWLATLAHNIAWGAALCRSYWDGVRTEAAHHMHAPWITPWRPGDGNEAP